MRLQSDFEFYWWCQIFRVAMRRGYAPKPAIELADDTIRQLRKTNDPARS